MEDNWEETLRKHCKVILEEKEGSILLSQLGTLISRRFPNLHQKMKDKKVQLVMVLEDDGDFIIEGNHGFISARLKVQHERQVIEYVLNRLKDTPDNFIKLSALGNDIGKKFPDFRPQDQGYQSLKDFISKSHTDFQIVGNAGLIGVYLRSRVHPPQTSPQTQAPKELPLSKPPSQYRIDESAVAIPKREDLRTDNSKIYLTARYKGVEPCVVKKLLAPIPVNNIPALDKLLREVEIQARFSNHDNICPLRGYFVKNDKLYLVTPLMKCSLRQEIQARGRLPLAKVILIAYGIASGVNHLHINFDGEKTMHRDLNASNVLLNEQGVPKISDFGLARTASDATKVFTVNKGTTASIAPEMIDPNVTEKEYTEKVDVWGFAMILYEMLSGELPFGELNVIGLSQLFTEEAKTGVAKRPPIEAITNNDNVFSKILIELMKQCWQFEPKNRPDFKSILQALTPLRAAVNKRHPVPEFWNLQQRLDLIGYVGDRCTKLQTNDPMAILLESNQESITGGDWTALFDEEILEVLDHQVSLPEDRASVVKLVREISNIKRHMKDSKNKSSQITMAYVAEKVDRSFPRLVHHLFVAVKLHCADILDIIFPTAN